MNRGDDDVSEKKPSRMIDIDLFTHPKMRATSATAKALFVYLLCPNPSGINCLSIRQMRLMVDASATDECVADALAQLCQVGVVRWDPANEVVWVVKALERQARGASPKIAKCVNDHLAHNIPPESPLVAEFRKRYAEWFAKASDKPEVEIGRDDTTMEPDASQSSPRLRLVEPAIPYLDTLSTCGMGISDTEPVTDTELETESRVVENPTPSREQPDRERRDKEPTLVHVEIEKLLLAIVAEAGIATGASPGFVTCAVERVLDGDATPEDVRTVAVEFKRRLAAGDRTQGWFRDLFQAGRRWYRTQREYLHRVPKSAPRHAVRSTASLPGIEDHWRRVRATHVPEPHRDPTPEEQAADEAFLASFAPRPKAKVVG